MPSSACNVSIAISRRTRTAAATSMARSRTRSRSTARIATARSSDYPTLLTSGPAAPPGGTDLSLLRTEDGRTRFEWREPASSISAPRSIPNLRMGSHAGQGHGRSRKPEIQRQGGARQADVRTDGSMQWGPGVDPSNLAHGDDKMACFTCHSSWTTSCAGCHLPIEANWKTATPPLRGRRDAQLRDLQPAGRARRHVPARPSMAPVKGNIIAPVALELGAGPVVDQHQPRAHLCAAAADLGSGLLEPGLRAALSRTPSAGPRPRPAPTATSRSRTTTTRSWRSCCCWAPISSISSATTPGSASRRRHRGGARHRMGRAAGGDRQLSAADTPIPTSTAQHQARNR